MLKKRLNTKIGVSIYTVQELNKIMKNSKLIWFYCHSIFLIKEL